jgi:hypothetical protein
MPNSIEAIASHKSAGCAWTFDDSWSLNDGFVLSAHALTTAQFCAVASATPCQRLLAAILEDAIHCFQKNCGSRDRRRRIIFREAEAWLFDRRATGFTSCRTVCESLGMDAVQLWRYLRRWRLMKKAGLATPPLRQHSVVSTDLETTRDRNLGLGRPEPGLE